MGTADLGVAILRANGEFGALRQFDGEADEGRGRAYRRLGASKRASHDAIADRRKFGKRGLQAVHLPVSGDKRTRTDGHEIRAPVSTDGASK